LLGEGKVIATKPKNKKRSPPVETSDRLLILCSVFNMTQLYFTRIDILRETNLGIVHWRRQEPIASNRVSRRYVKGIYHNARQTGGDRSRVAGNRATRRV
jgi:hypothetical protein